MKLVVTGASGQIGSMLVDSLWNEFHSLVLLSRRPPKEINVTKKEWIAWQPGVGGEWEKGLDGADGIINLAGEPIAGKRWSPEQKRKLRSSRIDATRSIVEAIGKATVKPKFFVSASAVGFYGAHGDEIVTEQTRPGDDFLARLCVDWEAEARKAEQFGVRVALVRTGIVLQKGKGALAKMVAPFKMFAGGPLGSGRQWFPWIHIDDEIALIRFLVDNDVAAGPFNATAPNPVTMETFARDLGKVLNRPSWASVPASVLAIAVGEMAEMLLNGQRAVPQAALKLGYNFTHPNLAEALQSLNL